jgi:hypothetical protein
VHFEGYDTDDKALTLPTTTGQLAYPNPAAKIIFDTPVETMYSVGTNPKGLLGRTTWDVDAPYRLIVETAVAAPAGLTNPNTYKTILGDFGILSGDPHSTSGDPAHPYYAHNTRFRLLTFAIKFDGEQAYQTMVDQLTGATGTDAEKAAKIRAMFNVQFKPCPRSTIDSNYFGITKGDQIAGSYPINPADIIVVGSEGTATPKAEKYELYLIVRLRPNLNGEIILENVYN